MNLARTFDIHEQPTIRPLVGLDGRSGSSSWFTIAVSQLEKKRLERHDAICRPDFFSQNLGRKISGTRPILH